MKRHVILYEELKRLRERQRKRWGPVPLELPLEIPYWPIPDTPQEQSDPEEPNRVVIIDMNDYCEVEP